MINKDEAEETFKRVWPDWDEYAAMSKEERTAYTLQQLNAARAEIGGPPLDHLLTNAEIKAYWDAQEAAYRAEQNTWRARWNRFLDRLLGPA